MIINSIEEEEESEEEEEEEKNPLGLDNTNKDPFVFIPEKLPRKPGELSWGWFIFWGLIFFGVGAIIYFIVKFSERNDPEKYARWVKEIAEVNKRNAQKQKQVEESRKAGQKLIDATIKALKTNYDFLIKNIKDLDDYYARLKKEKELIGGFLVPKTRVNDILKFFEFVKQTEASDNYNGCVVLCKNCSHLWTVKKEYGLPSTCPRCNRKYIKFEPMKSFIKKYGITFDNINGKEINNLNEQLDKLKMFDGISMVEGNLEYEGFRSLERTDELEQLINKFKPKLKELKDSINNIIERLDLNNIQED